MGTLKQQQNEHFLTDLMWYIEVNKVIKAFSCFFHRGQVVAFTSDIQKKW